MRRIAAFALVVVVAACGGKAPPPKDPPPLGDPAPVAGSAAAPGPAAGSAATGPKSSDLSDADFEKLMQQVVQFYTALGDAMASAGADCKVMAKNLKTTGEKYKPLLARLRGFADADAAAARAEAWVNAHQDQVKPAITRMGEGMAKCKDDPAIQEAQLSLEP